MSYKMKASPLKHEGKEEFDRAIHSSYGITPPQAINRHTGEYQTIPMHDKMIKAAAIIGGNVGQSEINNPSNLDIELTLNGEPVTAKSPMTMRRRRMHGKKRIKRTK